MAKWLVMALIQKYGSSSDYLVVKSFKACQFPFLKQKGTLDISWITMCVKFTGGAAKVWILHRFNGSSGRILKSWTGHLETMTKIVQDPDSVTAQDISR